MSPEIKAYMSSLGKIKSESKTKAAQKNGKKGGRPKKKSTETTS